MRKSNVGSVIRGLVITLGLSALTSGMAAAADSVVAKIPFEFRAGTADLPAGSYPMAIDWNTEVLTLQDLSSTRNFVAQFVTSISNESESKADQARVVFEMDGDGRYSLSKVWLSEAEGARVETEAREHAQKYIAAMK